MSDKREAWSELYEAAEDAMADGLTEEEALQAVRNAASSLDADRVTAEEEGRPDPYPHLEDRSDRGYWLREWKARRGWR